MSTTAAAMPPDQDDHINPDYPDVQRPASVAENLRERARKSLLRLQSRNYRAGDANSNSSGGAAAPAPAVSATAPSGSVVGVEHDLGIIKRAPPVAVLPSRAGTPNGAARKANANPWPASSAIANAVATSASRLASRQGDINSTTGAATATPAAATTRAAVTAAPDRNATTSITPSTSSNGQAPASSSSGRITSKITPRTTREGASFVASRPNSASGMRFASSAGAAKTDSARTTTRKAGSGGSDANRTTSRGCTAKSKSKSAKAGPRSPCTMQTEGEDNPPSEQSPLGLHCSSQNMHLCDAAPLRTSCRTLETPADVMRLAQQRAVEADDQRTSAKAKLLGMPVHPEDSSASSGDVYNGASPTPFFPSSNMAPSSSEQAFDVRDMLLRGQASGHPAVLAASRYTSRPAEVYIPVVNNASGAPSAGDQKHHGPQTPSSHNRQLFSFPERDLEQINCFEQSVREQQKQLTRDLEKLELWKQDQKRKQLETSANHKLQQELQDFQNHEHTKLNKHVSEVELLYQPQLTKADTQLLEVEEKMQKLSNLKKMLLVKKKQLKECKEEAIGKLREDYEREEELFRTKIENKMLAEMKAVGL
ncbi:unnamed protein product [Amoebophrya sp. A120]|nr:unnamed protein product [Amoebophrya sp. A120]|eukprot:GSA120T00019792001.1